MNLQKKNIPESLWGIIELAEYWGISDDSERIEQIENASYDKRIELKKAADKYEDCLDMWLGGVESQGLNFSNEYIAFSAMRMASDYLGNLDK